MTQFYLRTRTELKATKREGEGLWAGGWDKGTQSIHASLWKGRLLFS